MRHITLFSITIFLVSTLASSEIHPLRPLTGSSGHDIAGVSCLSWRLGVETHNIIEWKTVPFACENYMGHYMLGDLYRKDSRAVTDEAFEYAKTLKLVGDGKDIWVFDIDETSLSNLPYYAKHGFGVEPYNPTLFNKWVFEGKAPALPESLNLYNNLVSIGFKIVFLSGRTKDQRSITETNLKNVGYHTWNKLLLKGPANKGITAVAYKSKQRKMVEKKGYRIWGNIGDQWSDILGTHDGNRTFKLPDPMYYIS